MKKSIGIFMPARLQSERLPNKHVLPLNDSGISMWWIACENLSKIQILHKYVLIAESDLELVKIANHFKLNIIYRDFDTTTRDSPLNFVFKDISSIPTTHIMFLNPCVLNMSKDTIENAILHFEGSNYEYGTSVLHYKNWILDTSGNSLIDQIDFTKISTKDIPDRFEFAHCFHIFNKSSFFLDGMMLKENFMMLEVKKVDTLIDIDNEDDYNLAKAFYLNKTHAS